MSKDTSNSILIIVAIIGAAATIAAAVISGRFNYNNGYMTGFEAGKNAGYDAGYNNGYEDGIQVEKELGGSNEPKEFNEYEPHDQNASIAPASPDISEAEIKKDEGNVSEEPNKSEAQAKKTVKLENLSIWQTGGVVNHIGPYQYRTVTDNLGNKYNSYFSGSSTKDFNTYRINGEYVLFTGEFVIAEKGNSMTSDGIIYIYGDDDLLASYTITGGDMPVAIDVDITGVELLKISIKGIRGSGGEQLTYLVNPELHREL